MEGGHGDVTLYGLTEIIAFTLKAPIIQAIRVLQ